MISNEEYEILTNEYDTLINSMSILFYKDILAPFMMLGVKRLKIDTISAWILDSNVELSELSYGLPFSNDLYITMMCKIRYNIVTISFYNGNININMYVYDENNTNKGLLVYTTKSVRLIKKREVFSTTNRHIHSESINPREYVDNLEEYIIPLIKGLSERIKSELIRLQNNEER